MNITREQILHLAKLSRLNLEEHEIDPLKADLERIINYISELDQFDVSDLEPTYQAFEMTNIWREDEILPQDASPEDLLELAPDSLSGQIKVPKVL